LFIIFNHKRTTTENKKYLGSEDLADKRNRSAHFIQLHDSVSTETSNKAIALVNQITTAKIQANTVFT